MITEPGIYNISAAEYHADPCPAPSLSSSIACVICQDSPLHAKAKHPRLTPSYIAEEADHFDIGTAAHDLFLEGTDRIVEIDAKDYRTNVAKEARDAARANGDIPLLAKHAASVRAMVAAIEAQIDAIDPSMFDGDLSMAEQTLVWQESGLWCRARLDWLRAPHIDDLKTTSATANPAVWTRTMFQNGYDIQAAWYLRGLRALGMGGGEFRFAVVETFAPYALSVVAPGPDVLTVGDKKCLYAIEQWQRGLETGRWPGYPQRVCYAELPAWAESQWLQKEMTDAV